MTNTTLLDGTNYAYATDARYRAAVNRLAQGVADLNDLTGVMRSIQQESGASRTIYTLMADLSKREVTTYYAGEGFRTPHLFGFFNRQTAPVLNEGGTVNGASYSQSISAGQIASVFGTNLAGAPHAAASMPLPSSLEGVTVTLNDRPVPLFYVSPFQINFQVPWELADHANAEIRVTVDGVGSEPATVSLSTYGPGIFAGAIVGQDGSLVTADRPAIPGEYLSVYCTGLGPVTNVPVTGHEPSPRQLAVTLAPVEVWIGGAAAEVSYAGLAPGLVGVYQVNFRLPEAAGGTFPLDVSVGGVRSNAIAVTVGSRQGQL